MENGAYLFDYIEADARTYPRANPDYYLDVYAPRFERMNSTLAEILYYSECLENFTAAGDLNAWNNPNDERFRYSDELLYNINNDKIEACAVQNNEAKKQELLDYLIARSYEYNVPVAPYDVVYGSLRGI